MYASLNKLSYYVSYVTRYILYVTRFIRNTLYYRDFLWPRDPETQTGICLWATIMWYVAQDNIETQRVVYI